MIFAGEGAWRWRMLLASSDTTYERFWRQSVRWLTTSAPGPVEITVTNAGDAAPGRPVALEVRARDGAFQPVQGTSLTLTATGPDRGSQTLEARADESVPGTFVATLRPDRAGMYRIHAEATAGDRRLGSADSWVNAGSADPEFADPRLNEPFLRRLAQDSGGRYTSIDEVSHIAEWFQALPSTPTAAPLETRELWQQPWIFLLVVALLCSEWGLRRFWGLR